MSLSKATKSNTLILKMLSCKIVLTSLNARGLGDKHKRRTILKWIQSNHSKKEGIIFLQETHTTKLSEQIWQKDWNCQAFFSLVTVEV